MQMTATASILLSHFFSYATHMLHTCYHVLAFNSTILLGVIS